jgi:hypothetical protein
MRYRDTFTLWLTFSVIMLFFMPPLGIILLGITFPIWCLGWLVYGFVWAIAGPFRK